MSQRTCRGSRPASEPARRARMGAGALQFLALAIALVVGTAALAQTRLRVLGEVSLASGLKIDGVEFGGLSGLDYDPATGRFLALSDDRAERGPARLYEMTIGIDEQGISALEVIRMITLKGRDGAAYDRLAVDPEEVRRLPSGNIVWSDETAPALIEATREGHAVGQFDLPAYHVPRAGQIGGQRANLGHEALAITPDGTQLVAITESALAQDGPNPTLAAGAHARLLVFDIATRKPISEFVYAVERIPVASTHPQPFQDNGVTSALYLNDGRLLVMERSFARGVGTTIQIFEVALGVATNVLGLETLQGAAFTPVAKWPVMTLSTVRHGYDVDNLEGMALGPVVAGKPTIVLVSDNNFSRHQRTQFIALQVD